MPMYSNKPEVQAACQKAEEVGVPGNFISTLISLISSGKGQAILLLLAQLAEMFNKDAKPPA